MSEKSKIFFNIIFSFLSSVIPLVLLQLWVLPSTAMKLGNEKYGISIAIYSVLTIVASSGNALNNVRLIDQKEYKEKNLVGDFNLLLFFTEIVGTIITTISVLQYEGYGINLHLFLVLLTSVLMLMRSYLIVSYCIELNYFSLFINNLILAVGYFVGYFFMNDSDYWELIYVIGNLFGIIHLYFTTDLLREGIRRTKLFNKVTYQYVICLISSILSNVLNYIDKILIYPILGGTAVSIYYVSTLIGKIILMGISPINSVLLSYMSKLSYLKKRVFYLSVFLSIMMGGMGYIVCILLSRPCLVWLYPDLADQALKYIKIVTLTAVVMAYISLLSPLLLKFCNINWQIVISFVSLISYVVIVAYMAKMYGLYGFAIGGLLANIIKLALMFVIYIVNSKETKK